MAGYQQALDGEAPGQRKLRGNPGTFDRILQDYFASTAFTRLKPQTQVQYRNVLENWVRADGIGHRPVRTMLAAHADSMVARPLRTMLAAHADSMVARRAKTPAAANDLLTKMRILMAFAISRGERSDDPTRTVKRYKLGEHHTWTEAEIAAFEAHWAHGSRERMAFTLLLYTGQRLSDVVRMSWAQVEAGWISVTQQKTTARLAIPLHPTLKAMLAAWPRDQLVILATASGTPFKSKYFSKWFAARIAEAGLPEACVTHGLRKAAARRLAEAGATTLQIMAITGHKSLTEIERYTREAEQRRSAEAAMLKLNGRSANKDSQIG